MEFEVLMQFLSLTKTSKIGLMEKGANELLNSDDSEDSLLRLEELAEVALSNEKWVGDADDYHNFAVTYARLDQEDRACQILEQGMRAFPNNVDLLSDYIKYGVVCYEQEKCEKYYRKLSSIPKKRWNWRAYTFSIDYLLSTLEFSEVDEAGYNRIREEACDLAIEFQTYFPDNEQGYVSEHDISKAYNDLGNSQLILEKALSTLSVAPKCALRLADILFERGDYIRTLECLQRCEVDSIKPQSGIDMGYLYLLMALSEIALFLRKSDSKNQEASDQVDVQAIYRHASAANDLLKGKTSMRKNLRELIRMIELRTGVDYYGN